MNKYVQLTLWLLVPLILIMLVALSVYGLAGPADNDKNANAIGQLVGGIYGVYAVVLIIWRCFLNLLRRGSSK